MPSARAKTVTNDIESAIQFYRTKTILSSVDGTIGFYAGHSTWPTNKIEG